MKKPWLAAPTRALLSPVVRDSVEATHENEGTGQEEQCSIYVISLLFPTPNLLFKLVAAVLLLRAKNAQETSLPQAS